MNIREAQPKDIPTLAAIDQKAYGEKYGADERYFESKIATCPKGILLVEQDGITTGFIVFELMKSNQIPKDFCELKINEPLNGQWMFIGAFTTESNFLDTESDSQLVFAAEKIARQSGCRTFCVPLPKKHKFEQNKVFDFWEKCGYSRIGEIKWMASSTEQLDCYFYKKTAVV